MTNLEKQQELMDVERRFWNAIKAKDPKGTARMTDDGCIVVGAQGLSAIDQKTMAKLTEEGKWELQRIHVR